MYLNSQLAAKRRKATIISISFIIIFSFQPPLYVHADISIKNPDLKAELVLKGLKSPTSMSFLAEGDFLVLEKDGLVQRIVGNSILENPVLNLTSIVNSTRERGLLGIAISNDTASSKDGNLDSNSNIYLYLTERIPNIIHNPCNINNCTMSRVVNSLYVYEMNAGQLVNPTLLLSIPFGNADIGIEHLGGKITIGPDQRIYITGGDGYPCRNFEDCKKSIDKGQLNSKTSNSNGSDATGMGGILAISKDTKTNSSDSILGDFFPLNLYYAYGIRNSFGLDFDPRTGDLWDTENGPFFGDEINLVKPGSNSGWAKVQGIWPITNYNMLVKDLPIGYSFPEDHRAVNSGDLYDFNGNGKYTSPQFTWYDSIGATALKFFNSNELGEEYRDDMFVASYSKGRIYHFDLNEDRNSLATDIQLKNNVAYDENDLADFIFAQGFGPITDLQVSPDGFLYILSYEGNVWKITKSATS